MYTIKIVTDHRTNVKGVEFLPQTWLFESQGQVSYIKQSVSFTGKEQPHTELVKDIESKFDLGSHYHLVGEESLTRELENGGTAKDSPDEAEITTPGGMPMAEYLWIDFEPEGDEEHWETNVIVAVGCRVFIMNSKGVTVDQDRCKIIA